MTLPLLNITNQQTEEGRNLSASPQPNIKQPHAPSATALPYVFLLFF
jgi:hypothetical protein